VPDQLTLSVTKIDTPYSRRQQELFDQYVAAGDNVVIARKRADEQVFDEFEKRGEA
jgi:hypothetical protein